MFFCNVTARGERVAPAQMYQTALIERNYYPILSRLRLLQGAETSRLEISNVVPKEVEVLGLEWVDKDSGKRYVVETRQVPMLMAARGIGSDEQSWFVDVGTAPAEPGDWSVEAVVRLRDRNWFRVERAYVSYAPLAERPIPVGSIEQLRTEHDFLEIDEAGRE